MSPVARAEPVHPRSVQPSSLPTFEAGDGAAGRGIFHWRVIDRAVSTCSAVRHAGPGCSAGTEARRGQIRTGLDSSSSPSLTPSSRSHASSTAR